MAFHKMIGVHPRTYEMLNLLKSKGESFNDVIEALALHMRPELATMDLWSNARERKSRPKKSRQKTPKELREEKRRDYFRKFEANRKAKRLAKKHKDLFD